MGVMTQRDEKGGCGDCQEMDLVLALLLVGESCTCVTFLLTPVSPSLSLSRSRSFSISAHASDVCN